MGEEGQRQPYSLKGESKRDARGLWKSRPQGHSSLGYTYRDSSSIPKTATLSSEVVYTRQAKAERDTLRAPHPNVSPSEKGSAGTAAPRNINKGPFSPTAKLEQQRPADSEDRAGGGTDESGGRQRNQTRGGGGPSEWETSAEAGGAVIPSAQ